MTVCQDEETPNIRYWRGGAGDVSWKGGQKVQGPSAVRGARDGGSGEGPGTCSKILQKCPEIEGNSS